MPKKKHNSIVFTRELIHLIHSSSLLNTDWPNYCGLKEGKQEAPFSLTVGQVTGLSSAIQVLGFSSFPEEAQRRWETGAKCLKGFVKRHSKRPADDVRWRPSQAHLELCQDQKQPRTQTCMWDICPVSLSSQGFPGSCSAICQGSEGGGVGGVGWWGWGGPRSWWQVTCLLQACLNASFPPPCKISWQQLPSPMIGRLHQPTSQLLW